MRASRAARGRLTSSLGRQELSTLASTCLLSRDHRLLKHRIPIAQGHGPLHFIIGWMEQAT